MASIKNYSGVPDFLYRPALPMTEDMNTEPVLKLERKDNVPHELPPNKDGMNMLELYLTEGGQRRYLVVEQSSQTLQLLHLPDLEHVEVDVRTVNEQIAKGRAHWFDLPPNLDERIIAKSVQWETYRYSYSRKMVNIALTKLGRPEMLPRELAENVAKKREKLSAMGKAKSANNPIFRGIGVVDTIVQILKDGGGTVEEMFAKLKVKFPDPEKGTIATIRTQLARLPKQGKLVIHHDKATKRYWADGSTPTPPAQKDLFKRITGVFDPAVDAIAEMPKSDFVEQIAKQKAREKEYIANPVIGKVDRKKITKGTPAPVAKKKGKASKKKKG